MGNKHRIVVFLLTIAFLMLILDSKTSSQGAAEGIGLCIKVVIPSLFPFLFLSACLTGNNLFPKLPSLHRLGVPKGAESIFLLGLLGGYPVGAQMIRDNYQKGILTKQTAQRLLGFCNNPGPAFAFGMLSPLFTVSAAPWCLWGIIILSAIITGLLLPGKTEEISAVKQITGISLPAALNKSTRSMGLICGWVILFRVFFSIAENILLKRLPQIVRICFVGLMELTNGCVTLSTIPSEPLRFVLCAAFLSFGGLCVAMQTGSCTQELGLGMYFPGKLLQTFISILLASGVSFLIF